MSLSIFAGCGGEKKERFPLLARSISLAVGNTCAITVDGTLWCWGDNNYGQLGNGKYGHFEKENIPVQVGTDMDWVDVSISSGGTWGEGGW